MAEIGLSPLDNRHIGESSSTRNPRTSIGSQKSRAQENQTDNAYEVEAQLTDDELRRTPNEEVEQASLPRADGGKDAWLFLAGCFMIEALVWGFPFSFGVFQAYYTSLDLFKEQSSGIAVIGTSASGVMYLGAPLIFFILHSWPHLRRYSGMVGLAIITLALIASSFSNKVWHLILTQGVLYAIGGSLLYAPTILYLDEWFIARKGFAFGVMWGGTGASGVIVPLVMSWGLGKYGFRTMLRVWALTLVILAGPLNFYVKPRIPLNSQSATARRRTSWAFLKRPVFLALQASNILESFGFFIPGVYLPSYARTLGMSTLAGSSSIVMLNATSVIGQVGLGYLVDRMHVTTVIMISTVGATISVFLLWGFSVNVPVLYIFSLAYGLFAGGFTAIYTGVIKEVQKHDQLAETGTIFGLLAAGRGIGAVSSGPISEALLGPEPWKGVSQFGYGSGYGVLIVFTGISAMLGGISFVSKRVKLI